MEKEKSLKEGIKKTKEQLESEKIKAESNTISIEVVFDELNRVESDQTIVHFKNSISEEEKNFLMEYLEEFVLALNRAQYKRARCFTDTLKKLQTETTSKSA